MLNRNVVNCRQWLLNLSYGGFRFFRSGCEYDDGILSFKNYSGRSTIVLDESVSSYVRLNYVSRRHHLLLDIEWLLLVHFQIYGLKKCTCTYENNSIYNHLRIMPINLYTWCSSYLCRVLLLLLLHYYVQRQYMSNVMYF